MARMSNSRTLSSRRRVAMTVSLDFLTLYRSIVSVLSRFNIDVRVDVHLLGAVYASSEVTTVYPPCVGVECFQRSPARDDCPLVVGSLC